MNNKKDYAVFILWGIIILLLIIGGAYIYEAQVAKVSAPTVDSTSVATSTATSTQSALTYADQDFGFSFSYPNDWQVTKAAPSQDTDGNISVGKVLATLLVGEKDAAGNAKPEISIQEVQSPSMTITDNFGTASNPTYFFNPSSHTWMTVQNDPAATTTADISVNTMGGLHMFGTKANTYYAYIIPLSAQNFLVVNNIDDVDSTYLDKTILALDPAVATPVSSDEQAQTIQNEIASYDGQSGNQSITWQTYTDSQNGFSFQYPTSLNGSGANLIFGPSGKPDVFVTSTSSDIGTNGCYHSSMNYGGGPATNDSKITLNGTQFCLSSGGDAGMSQLYTTDDYTTERNGLYITIQYVIHTTNGCGVYQGDPTYAACEYLSKNYDELVTQPIQKSVGSLTFTN